MTHHSTARRKTPPAGVTIIVWQRQDQKAAIEHDLYLERDTTNNRVVIKFLNRKGHPSIIASIAALQNLANDGDPFGLRALRFIQQQAEHGWSGAWADKVIERASWNIRWYRDYEHNVTRAKQLATTRLTPELRTQLEHEETRAAEVAKRRTGRRPRKVWSKAELEHIERQQRAGERRTRDEMLARTASFDRDPPKEPSWALSIVDSDDER